MPSRNDKNSFFYKLHKKCYQLYQHSDYVYLCLIDTSTFKLCQYICSVCFIAADNCANCHFNADCINGHCECRPGYEGDGKQRCEKTRESTQISFFLKILNSLKVYLKKIITISSTILCLPNIPFHIILKVSLS